MPSCAWGFARVDRSFSAARSCVRIITAKGEQHTAVVPRIHIVGIEIRYSVELMGSKIGRLHLKKLPCLQGVSFDLLLIIGKGLRSQTAPNRLRRERDLKPTVKRDPQLLGPMLPVNCVSNQAKAGMWFSRPPRRL